MQSGSSDFAQSLSSETLANKDATQISIADAERKRKERLYGSVFLTTVAGAAAVFGFGMTLAIAKKKDPTMFSQNLIRLKKDAPESGGSLAMRALGWGTVYAVTGFSVFCLGVWKLMGVHDLQEFRYKAGTWLPKLSKSHQEGRTEFASIRELFNYLIEEDEKKKRTK